MVSKDHSVTVHAGTKTVYQNRAIWWWSLAALPCLALVFATRYRMNFPWAEDWAFADKVLVPLYDGRLSWQDLCQPLNGYVKISSWLPRTILAWLTDWNQTWEIALNLVCGLGILTGVLLIVRDVARSAGRPFPHILVPVMAAVVLGLNKSCIWLWGDGLTYTISVCAAVWGMAIVARPNPSWRRLAFAGVMGVVSSLAFASGLIYVVSTGILLALSCHTARRTKILIVWFSYVLLLIVLYVWLTAGGAVRPPRASYGESVRLTLLFLPIYLGAGITKFALSQSGPVGLTGLVAGTVLVVKLLRSRELRPAALPFVHFALFALLCGVAVGMGRGRPERTLYVATYAGFLEGAALRYPFFSQFFWLSLIGMGWLWQNGSSDKAILPVKQRRIVFKAFLLLLLVFVLASGRTGYYEAQERYHQYSESTRKIVDNNLKAVPERAQWPYGYERREVIKTMRTHKLSIFRTNWESKDQ